VNFHSLELSLSGTFAPILFSLPIIESYLLWKIYISLLYVVGPKPLKAAVPCIHAIGVKVPVGLLWQCHILPQWANFDQLVCFDSLLGLYRNCIIDNYRTQLTCRVSFICLNCTSVPGSIFNMPLSCLMCLLLSFVFTEGQFQGTQVTKAGMLILGKFECRDLN